MNPLSKIISLLAMPAIVGLFAFLRSFLNEKYEAETPKKINPNSNGALNGQAIFKNPLNRFAKKQDTKQPLAPPKAVGEFYNETTDQFLQVYGEVIQAFRTTDVSKLLNYQMEMMEMKPGQKALDAGCGICGPATYFAQHGGITVEAVTISEKQVQKAKANIEAKGLTEKVNVRLGDYHKLPDIFGKEQFDIVYFLESFGHSNDQEQAIKSAWEVLKPGGMLYIKDLFKKIAVLPEHEAKIEYEIDKINQSYRYNIADLYKVLHYVRKLGFILAVVKTIDLKIEDFENLTISNDFQELTGIALIENWEEYIFPVDFFEIKCFKPVYGIQVGHSRYFLQNLYHMKVWDKNAKDL